MSNGSDQWQRFAKNGYSHNLVGRGIVKKVPL